MKKVQICAWLVVKELAKPAILKTNDLIIFSSSDSDEKMKKLNLFYLEKIARNDCIYPNGEIIAIVNKFFGFDCLRKQNHANMSSFSNSWVFFWQSISYRFNFLAFFPSTLFFFIIQSNYTEKIGFFLFFFTKLFKILKSQYETSFINELFCTVFAVWIKKW